MFVVSDNLIRVTTIKYGQIIYSVQDFLQLLLHKGFLPLLFETI